MDEEWDECPDCKGFGWHETEDDAIKCTTRNGAGYIPAEL
jgi:DnaJ-class molecular chaperone